MMMVMRRRNDDADEDGDCDGGYGQTAVAPELGILHCAKKSWEYEFRHETVAIQGSMHGKKKTCKGDCAVSFHNIINDNLAIQMPRLRWISLKTGSNSLPNGPNTDGLFPGCSLHHSAVWFLPGRAFAPSESCIP